MKNKILLLTFSLALVAAACNLFKAPVAAGVIKTVNGGTDWQFSNAVKDVKNGSIGGLSISKLAFDPQNDQVVYAGSYVGGLYKSEDSGETWKNILSKILVYDLAVNPRDPKTIYAAGSYADHGKVIKTTDGGATWQEVYNEASAQNPVRSVVLDPANPTQVVIGLHSGSVIRSGDSGSSWKLLTNFEDRVNRMAWQSSGLFVLLQNKGLAVSTDGGNSFQFRTESLVKDLGSGTSSSISGYSDTFSQFYVDPNIDGLIYLTTSRGPYKTMDGGNTWTFLRLPTKGGTGNARAIIAVPGNSNVVYTSVDATVYKSLDGGNTWQTQQILTGGFVNAFLIDPQKPQIVYGGIYSQ